MPLSARHAEAIERLGREEFALLNSKIIAAVGRRTPFRTRAALIKLCETPSVHPRDLQMPFVRETDELGLAVLECLVGHKIVRGPTIVPRKFQPILKPKRKRRANGHSGGTVVAAKGDMVIRMLVRENPKREGSAAALRFAKYRDGIRVADAMERGVRASDLRYDQRHGYIELRSAR